MFPSSPNQTQHMMHHNNSNPPRPTRRQEPLPRHPYNPYPPLYQQPPFTDPSLQQFLGPHTNTSPWGEGGPPIQHYHSSLNSTGPSRVVARQYQHQYEPPRPGPSQAVAWQYQHQYEPPRPGPSYNPNSRGHRMTEAQHTTQHVSSRTISRDHSTNIHPVNTQMGAFTGIHAANARMGAFNDTAIGRASRPPPRNPLVVNNDWQRARPKPYDRNCTTQKKRPRKVNLSMYQVPITGSERNATEYKSNVPTPTSATAGTTQKTANVDKQEQRTEEEDFDTISLGSDTD